jgi:hypothetical protein
MPVDHLNRIDSEIEKFGGSKEVIDIATIAISDLILGSPRTAKFAIVDFLSVDVERRELYVLDGIDFEHMYFRAIMLEANTELDREEHHVYLERHGYKEFQKFGINTLYMPTDSCTAAFMLHVSEQLGVSIGSFDIGFQVGNGI